MSSISFHLFTRFCHIKDSKTYNVSEPCVKTLVQCFVARFLAKIYTKDTESPCIYVKMHRSELLREISFSFIYYLIAFYSLLFYLGCGVKTINGCIMLLSLYNNNDCINLVPLNYLYLYIQIPSFAQIFSSVVLNILLLLLL